MVRDLIIEVHEVGRRHGEWCDACALPSVVEIDVAFVAARTLRTLSRCTIRICVDRCGRLENGDRRAA